MRKYLNIILAAMIIAVLGLASWISLSVGGSTDAEMAIPVFAEIQHQPEPLNNSLTTTHEDEEVTESRISEGTLITYDFYHSETGEYESITEYAAESLLGMTIDDLKRFFADWQVLSFDPYEVHLRQNSTISYQDFIIGIHEGYIAVFYNDEHNAIKELTTRPISALAPEEQERLFEGIRVTGNEELMRALEDFGS